MMNQGIDQGVAQRVDAYRGNPQALQQKYAVSQELVDLLALQKIKSEKEAAARQMQMQMAQQQAANGEPPTVAEQREKEVMDMTKEEMIQQQSGIMQQKQQQQQEGMQKLAQGIASAPGAQMAAQPQMMAAGGIVAFAEGGEAEEKERWQDMKRRPDETSTEFVRRVEKAKQKNFQAEGPSKLIEFFKGRGDRPLIPEAEANAAGAAQAETAALGNRYPAPAPSINDPLSPDGSSVVPAAAPAFAPKTFLNNGAATADPVAQNSGIGAIAQSQAIAQSPAMTDALATRSGALADLSAIEYNPPPAVEPQTVTQRFEGAKNNLAYVKEYMGENKYSDEARKIIEERTADLTNPDRNKFDKALAWFKGAAAMQKGRGLESIANAAGEVAGAYSVIKKEDRKEKNAIRDMNLNLTKAEQARKDGQKLIAMDLQKEAYKNEVAAAEAAAKRYEAGLTVETAVNRALFDSANKRVSDLMTNETQNRSIDSTAKIAGQRIESDEKTRKQTAAGQQDYRDNTAYIAASDYYRKTEADVAASKAKDVPLQNIISNIARYERKAANGKLDQEGRANLEALKAKQKIMESEYTRRLQIAKDRFNVISERVMGAANVSTVGNDQEAAARQWLKNNPNDPRAAAIRTKLGM